MTAENCSIILLAIFFGCARGGAEKTDAEAPAPDSAQPAARVDSPAAAQTQAGWTAATTQGEGTATGIAVLTAVRGAAHPDFERLTFEFDTAGIPSYHIEYIDRPVRACGSGEPVPIAGDAWLEIRFSGANAHTEQGAPTIPERDRKLALPILRQLTSTCDFEAEVTWVAGVSTPARYRVLELSGPARLVIDLRTSRE